MSIAFYISGHGFGHAVRQIEIINALAALDPAIPIVVRTSASRRLFERNARAALTVIDGEVDTGAVQSDGLTLDDAETVRRATWFYIHLDGRARQEVDLLKGQGVTLVVSDAPPLACSAAELAGVPSAVCSNFTWDWIYAGYAASAGVPSELLSAVRGAYSRASAGWRLPMHGGFETVPSVVDVPFVARPATGGRSRDELRQMLGLPLGDPLALVSFGGYGLEGLPLDRLDCSPPWEIVLTTGDTQSAQPVGAPAIGCPHLLGIAESSIYSAGLGYHDVVAAVDVVITKPGYGIISDCIANGTAILYTSRGRFAEYDVLVGEMPRYLRCGFIDHDALRAGTWGAALDRLMLSPPPPERARIDGAQTVAGLIAEYV